MEHCAFERRSDYTGAVSNICYIRTTSTTHGMEAGATIRLRSVHICAMSVRPTHTESGYPNPCSVLCFLTTTLRILLLPSARRAPRRHQSAALNPAFAQTRRASSALLSATASFTVPPPAQGPGMFAQKAATAGSVAVRSTIGDGLSRIYFGGGGAVSATEAHAVAVVVLDGHVVRSAKCRRRVRHAFQF